MNVSGKVYWSDYLHPLRARLKRAPPSKKSIAPLRGYVAEPMRYKRLFLAGDAAHIVPPTGAKGLNPAASDAYYLAQAISAVFNSKNESLIDSYSDRCLKRIWKAERFSWYMTSLLHKFPNDDLFSQRIQGAEIDYVANSKAMQMALAENYIGLPL